MVPPSRRSARGKEQTTLEDTNVTGSRTDFSVHFEEKSDAFEVFEGKFPTYNWTSPKRNRRRKTKDLCKTTFEEISSSFILESPLNLSVNSDRDRETIKVLISRPEPRKIGSRGTSICDGKFQNRFTNLTILNFVPVVWSRKNVSTTDTLSFFLLFPSCFFVVSLFLLFYHRRTAGFPSPTLTFRVPFRPI